MILNKILRKIVMIPVHLVILVYTWVLAFITVSVPTSAVCFVFSAIYSIPHFLIQHFWVIYLIVTVPITISYFVIVETGKYKQDREAKKQWEEALRKVKEKELLKKEKEAEQVKPEDNKNA